MLHHPIYKKEKKKEKIKRNMFDEMGNPYRPYVRTIADHFKKITSQLILTY